jgi:hypothetical protein
MGEGDFQGRLLPGERIQWTGAPPAGLLLTGRDAFMIPFSLMWGGFAIFWEWGVVTGMGKGHPAPDFFMLWGVPFVLIGLYMIAGRFFVDAWIRGATTYALTSQRVLIMRTAPTFKFTALSLDRLPELSLSERQDGRGTIRFQPGASMWGGNNNGWSSWTPGLDAGQFLMIADARGVFDRIQKLTAKSGA